MTIAEIQQKLLDNGWRFQETTFSDGTVIVRLTQSPNPPAFSERTYELGWGRFPREQAWQMLRAYFDNRVADWSKPAHKEHPELSL